MPAVADITRSRRQRAGSRRNKRLKNVGSFSTDRRSGGVDMQAAYNRAVGNPTPPSAIPPDVHTVLHRAIQRMSLESLRRSRKARRGAEIQTRVPAPNGD